MRRCFRLLCTLTALALLVTPATTAAAPRPFIWITNTTGHCVWATVYVGAKIIRSSGFPGWVPPRHRGTFVIPSHLEGQKFRVRAEVLSTAQCTEHTADHPFVEDLSAIVYGSPFQTGFEVRLTWRNTYFHLERTL